MSQLENVLFWISMAAYFGCFICYLIDVTFKKERWGGRAWWLFVAAFVLQTATIGWRWYLSGRVPVMVSYEHYQLATWFTALCTIIGGVAYARMRFVSLGTAAANVFLLGLGVSTPSEMAPLTPPYKSNWLFIHIGFAWFAWGCFLLATILAAVYLLKSRRASEGAFLARFPALEVLDELMIRFILFGFVCQGLTIAAGAIWAHQLWGRYWGWDPIETWSLVAWLMYGLVLHFRLMMGWKGRKIALLVMFSLVTVIVYFWGIGFLPASHTSLMVK